MKKTETIRLNIDLYKEIKAERNRTDIPMAQLVEKAWNMYKNNKGNILDK